MRGALFFVIGLLIAIVVCEPSLYCRCYQPRALPPFVSEFEVVDQSACNRESCALKMNSSWWMVEEATTVLGVVGLITSGQQLWFAGEGRREWLSESLEHGDAIVFWSDPSHEDVLNWNWGTSGRASAKGAFFGKTFVSFQWEDHYAILLWGGGGNNNNNNNNRTDTLRLLDPVTPDFGITFSRTNLGPGVPIIIGACMLGVLALSYAGLLVFSALKRPPGSSWRWWWEECYGGGDFRILFGPVSLVLAVVTLASTLSYCFALALNLRHVSWSRFPPISMIGVHLPEHWWFVIGFCAVSFFLAQAQLSYAAVACMVQPRLRRRVLLHAALGLVQFPCLCAMAILDTFQTGALHFIFAIVGLAALIAYEVWHFWIDRAVFVVEVGKWRMACRIWYLVTAAGTLVGVIAWLSGCMICQWIAVLCIFFHFLPWLAILCSPFNQRNNFDEFYSQDTELLHM